MGRVLQPESPAAPHCQAGCGSCHRGGQEDAVEISQHGTATQLIWRAFGRPGAEQPGNCLKLQVSAHPRQPPWLWRSSCVLGMACCGAEEEEPRQARPRALSHPATSPAWRYHGSHFQQVNSVAFKALGVKRSGSKHFPPLLEDLLPKAVKRRCGSLSSSLLQLGPCFGLLPPPLPAAIPWAQLEGL